MAKKPEQIKSVRLEMTQKEWCYMAFIVGYAGGAAADRGDKELARTMRGWFVDMAKRVIHE